MHVEQTVFSPLKVKQSNSAQAIALSFPCLNNNANCTNTNQDEFSDTFTVWMQNVDVMTVTGTLNFSPSLRVRTLNWLFTMYFCLLMLMLLYMLLMLVENDYGLFWLPFPTKSTTLPILVLFHCNEKNLLYYITPIKKQQKQSDKITEKKQISHVNWNSKWC